MNISTDFLENLQLTPQQAAQYLGISYSHLRALHWAGGGPKRHKKKNGSYHYYLFADLDEYQAAKGKRSIENSDNTAPMVGA